MQLRRGTRIHYNYFRDYDASIGRYVESDPIGLDGGINTYLYVDAEPTDFSDPMGLVPGPYTGFKKFPSSHPRCVALKKKIESKKRALDERWADYNLPRNPQLPERLLKGRGEKLSKTRRGHRVLINIEDSTLNKLEKKYDDECFDECDQCTAATAAIVVTTVGAVGLACLAPELAIPVLLFGTEMATQ